MKHAILLALTLAACARAPADALQPAQARLRPQFVESTDGRAQRLLQLIDTEVDAPCTIAGAACVPRAGGTIIFLDDACTTPLVETAEGDHPWVTAIGFPPRAGPVRLGARVADTGGKRYMGGDLGYECFESGAQTDLPLYEAAEFLAPERLARGTLERADASAELTALSFIGEDGSRVLYDLIDRASGAGCAPAFTEAGARCKPDLARVHDEGLREPSCERLAVAEYGSIAVAQVAERGDEIYRFERAEDHRHIGRLEAESCAVEPWDSGRRTLYFGVPHPPPNWPELHLEKRGGGDRLTALAPSTPAGDTAEALARVDPAAMFEDRGTPCGPVWVEGTLRCLPAPAAEVLWWASSFADAECTRPAVAVTGDAAPPAQFTVREASAGRARADLPTGRAREVHGEPLTQGFELAGTLGCRASHLIGARFFELGAEIPGANYPELRLRTE